MMKFKFLCLFLLMCLVMTAQKVVNIAYRQEQSTIIVSYDLETKTPCKIDLYISTDGGITWQGPLKKVTGDVGAKIASGSLTITWNVLQEFEELRGDKIVFKVIAESEIVNIPDSIVKSNFNIVLPTIQIGGQMWTIKNLDVDVYSNGDEIPQVQNPNEWSKLTTGAWCYYDNDNKNGKIYGKLYNWYAVNDPRGLSPNGYHIPTREEIDFLLGYLGGSSIAGYKLKESGTKHWSPPNIYVTNSNSSGFTGLPGGCRNDSYGAFEGIGSAGMWWYGKYSNLVAIYFSVRDFTNVVSTMVGTSKASGFSVRCIKD